ncbi:protein of unknown function [Taphrina deformans PYCC 5710]|uniref:JmjC domain-containing protein n=1 Tax=Taphrina deformans (strain PYCC 5710 / ATCC 11124 / CBS 356.35 / IMI 108563 / JCM 9778 / NBRC 8474) TaxID=1097556 RepID=R4XB95_TAPDE|nr:protein of unknown function [Taphrina deformans PYCC 5710]|eukprot:CCG81617.1 protein of unknown function [Taphrina deformans PYCC 5710]
MRRLHTKTQMLPSTRFGENELYTLQKDLAAVTSAVFETNGIDTAQDIPILKHSEGLPYAKADYEELSFEAFRKHWATGQPLLLTGFQHRFELDWTPEYFISNHGDESTELVDVISKKVQPSSVGVFFEGLKSGSAKAMRHLKLNDWPVVDDFALAMPELFEDFERALPYPLYTRRHGFLNLATWFPSQFLPPDLGPKLYCAGASSDAAGAKGTTVLHMDMTDAINIMAWAGEKPENRPGCAVWDVFTPADLDPIRSYLIEKLRKENPKAIMDDPIRRAQFYLNKTDLEHLAQRGILSKRIYQNPGDAVFIPAGCAHQVCNLTPCIKIACDFVCPENISRCSMITEADRKLAEHAKREDVLQLQNIIYFAYLGVREWVQNPVFRESLATTRAEYTKLPEDHDKSTEIASPARATQTEPSTVLRRGKRKRKAFAYDEYDSQTVEDISSSHNAAERCCHDGPHASRKQSSHETHDKLMTHSKLDRMNSHSTQPTIESRKTRRKRLSTPQDGDNSELGPSKRTSRPTEPSRMVKLRLHQGDMPELTKISTAESAYASFIETYGHAKLADLFYADDSYLKRDMQASNDDIEQNKPSTQYLAGSSGASLNNTPHPTTHEITGAPGAFRAMDDNAVASAEKSRDQSADVDQSSIEGVDQATTNEGMEVLSQLTGSISPTCQTRQGWTKDPP